MRHSHGSSRGTSSFVISFPICITVFVAGWFSGCLFILVSLEPQRLPMLISPLESRFINHVDLDNRRPLPVLKSLSILLFITHPIPQSPHPRLVLKVKEDIEPDVIIGMLEDAKSKKTPVSIAEESRSDTMMHNLKERFERAGAEADIYRKVPSEIETSTEEVTMEQVEFKVASNLLETGRNILHTFPSYNENENSEKLIILDWAVDDRLFTVENYKALESVLTVYPNSSFRVILAAPNDAYTHKTGNQLSVMHFVKYKRKGYDIEVNPVGMVTSDIAKDYVEKYIKKCCFKCNAKCRVSDHVQPYHVLNYLRLNRLYRRGGIFTDFTFFFLGPLEPPEVIQGFYMNTFCNKQERMEKWQIEQQSRRVKGKSQEDLEAGLGFWRVNRCFTSTTLVFNTPKSPVIKCMLDKYGDTLFLECIENDTVYDGAYCVLTAFNECFSQNGVRNDLYVESPNTKSRNLRFDSTLLEEEAFLNALVDTKNSTEDESINLLENDHSKNDTLEVDLIGRRYLQKKKRAKLRHATAVAHAELIEGFQGDPELASSTMLSTDWHIPPYKRVLWLGSLGWSGHWTELPYEKDSLLDTITKTFKIKKNAYEARAECNLTCSHYSSNLSILSKLQSSSYDTGIERAACAPTVIVPGFMKSASTFLFSAITMHPQVLPPVKGAQLKETYCYHPSPIRKIMKRPWCFPYIEENENYLTADGTVYYATDPTIAQSLLEDNKNVKIVFAVRQPSDRIYSNYKFSYETYMSKGPIDFLIERGMDKNDKFGILRQMVLNGTSDDDMIKHYYSYPFKLGGALGVLFMHSLAFPAILHYRQVLGAENVMVVNAEDLDVKDMTRLREKMNEVFKFIGLCPFEIPEQMDGALIGKNLLPDEHDLSQDIYNRLTRFFIPFNDELMRITGFNLSHWNVKKPNSKLRKYIIGMNSSLPSAWFDVEVEKASVHKGLMQLLPHDNQVHADGGFNTTMGMITMF